MEEKKQIKISLKIAILLVFVFLVILGILVIFMLIFNNKNIINYSLKSTNQNDYIKKTINGTAYYEKLTDNTWTGKYHKNTFYTSSDIDSTMKIVSYNDYIKTIKNLNSTISNKKITPFYKNKNCNYIVLYNAKQNLHYEFNLIDCFVENNLLNIYGDEETTMDIDNGKGYFIAIPTNFSTMTKINYQECYTHREIESIKNSISNPSKSTLHIPSIDKPIIYLYPTEETKVSVKLLNDRSITCSYPKYNGKWKVLAKPNGDLKDLSTDRNLYSLYYESKSEIDFGIEKDGFIVKSDEVSKFLEEKLSILGLTQREAEEFIVYWLPKLEANKYNYIRFATEDEINQNMPLEIKPNPDTIIRILMTFKGLEKPINVQEQELTSPKREGFVAVEWGGTEIK